ncbi:hypothetical protein evm_011761 [Chilo suppressalis]|nr:hypothetical protein evm_011761 [Chilo suppressalis]
MGDGLKLSKDKRHRSSSSIAGVVVEGTRSERQLDIRASIPEVDDQFAIAEARCDDLQEKIDLVKVLKRKRKLKKRSTTRVVDTAPADENMPFISVQTQPKKKVSQQAARLRRLDIPPNPTRGYIDPATVEQHRMLGQVRGYNQIFHPQQEQNKHKQGGMRERQSSSQLQRSRRSRADGDAMTTCEEARVQIDEPYGVACGADDESPHRFTQESYPQRRNDLSAKNKRPVDDDPKIRQQTKTSTTGRRRNVPRDVPNKESAWRSQEPEFVKETRPQPPSRRQQVIREEYSIATPPAEERPVVELFNKTLASTPLPQHTNANKRPPKNGNIACAPRSGDQTTGPLRDLTETKMEFHRNPRRVKYRSRGYELPTVASQMKQAGMRFYADNRNTSNIPFIVSKSTAPSHNIGVNIQQVLNGIKVQQPVSGIPPTIAHHMGLGHIPTYGTRSAVVEPSLDTREINAIRAGGRLLRLPSYRYMSYNRLLALYREGDGMVPRFLRGVSRPHYFYTSMYNLATNREDGDGATSKGHGGGVHDAKQSLAEYAGLYREYEHIEKCIKDGNHDSELEQRRDELSKKLAEREDHIRRVVEEYRSEGDQVRRRASASAAEENYRHSTFKLNLADPPQ